MNADAVWQDYSDGSADLLQEAVQSSAESVQQADCGTAYCLFRGLVKVLACSEELAAGTPESVADAFSTVLQCSGAQSCRVGEWIKEALAQRQDGETAASTVADVLYLACSDGSNSAGSAASKAYALADFVPAEEEAALRSKASNGVAANVRIVQAFARPLTKQQLCALVIAEAQDLAERAAMTAQQIMECMFAGGNAQIWSVVLKRVYNGSLQPDQVVWHAVTAVVTGSRDAPRGLFALFMFIVYFSSVLLAIKSFVPCSSSGKQRKQQRPSPQPLPHPHVPANSAGVYERSAFAAAAPSVASLPTANAAPIVTKVSTSAKTMEKIKSFVAANSDRYPNGVPEALR